VSFRAASLKLVIVSIAIGTKWRGKYAPTVLEARDDGADESTLVGVVSLCSLLKNSSPICLNMLYIV